MNDKPYVRARISVSKLLYVWLGVIAVTCIGNVFAGDHVIPSNEEIVGIAISFVAVLFSNPVKTVVIPSLPTISQYPGAPKNYCEWMRLRGRVMANIRNMYPRTSENDMYAVLAAVESELGRDPV